MNSTNSMTTMDDLETLADQLSEQVIAFKQQLSRHSLRHPTLTAEGAVDLNAFSHEPPAVSECRRRISQIAQRVHSLVQGPIDSVTALSYAGVNAANLEALLRMRVAENVPLDESVTFQSLAETLQVDPDILKRISRLAIANGIFIEHPPGSVQHNAVSATLRLNKALRDVAQHNAGSISRICSYISAWERGTVTDVATSRSVAAFNLCHPGYKDWFEYIAVHKDIAREYYDFLDGRARLPRYNANQLLGVWNWAEELRKDDILIDVGGSSGQIVALLASVSEATFIVQDINEEGMEKGRQAIEEHRLQDRVTFMTHDFFKPQTVPANIFYFRNILHDWSDEKCIEILRALEPSLRVGARVLINEVLVPEPPAVLASTIDDVQARIDDHVMLASHLSKERDVDEYIKIFTTASQHWRFVRPQKDVGDEKYSNINDLLIFEWHL